MASPRDVLRGVRHKDLRQVMETLVAEGWTIEKTNGSHIKLTHKNASMPVYSSSTPSVYRGTKNLVAQCRRALRKVEMTEQSKTIGDLPAHRTAPARRKKERWTNEMRAARFSAELADTSTLETASHTEERKAGQTYAKNKSEKSSNVTYHKAFPMIETNKTVETAAPAKETKQPSGPALNVLPSDVLSIAMRLVKGELATIEITPEMVGQTLVLDGHAWVTNLKPGKAIVSTTSTVKGGEQVSGHEARRPTSQKGGTKDAVMEVLKTFPDTWISSRQVAELIDNTHKNAKSHRDHVRNTLNNLHDKGMVIRKEMPGTHGMSRKKYTYKLTQ